MDVWKLDLDELRAAPGFPAPRPRAPRVTAWSGHGGRGGAGTRSAGARGRGTDRRPGQVGGGTLRRPDHGNIMHGRGACDMKAGVAANLAVAPPSARSGVRLARPLALHAWWARRTAAWARSPPWPAATGGGRGHRRADQRGDHRRDGGALTFRIEVAGRAAHGSHPLRGGQRHRGLPPVLAVIRLWRPTATAIRTRLRRQPAALPDRDRHGPRGRLGQQRAGPPRRRGPLGVRLARIPRRPAWLWRPRSPTRPSVAARTPSGRHLARRTVRAAAAARGARADGPGRHGGGGGHRLPPGRGRRAVRQDLRLYAAGGIPALHYGPGDVRFAHAPREQVDLRELRDVTRVLALLALRRCGVRS